MECYKMFNESCTTTLQLPTAKFENVLLVTKFCPPSMLYKYGLSPEVGVITIEPSVETTEETVVARISTVEKVQASIETVS